jgi:transcriptional regulator with XRE-family HTH domain
MLNLPEIATEKEIHSFKQMVSNNIKKIRQEKKLSQLEVALSIGQKSSGFYANAENNLHDKHFNLVHLYKIAKLFQVDISEFFKH